jgi:hypothetical protein
VRRRGETRSIQAGVRRRERWIEAVPPDRTCLSHDGEERSRGRHGLVSVIEIYMGMIVSLSCDTEILLRYGRSKKIMFCKIYLYVFLA